MRLFTFIFIFFLAYAECLSQRTVGTISMTDEALDGLTFYSPFSSNRAFLVDNCGRLVNVWDRGTRPGLAAYFLENGMMLRTYKVSPVGPFTSASNAGGIELVDWDNNTVWSYELNTATELSHHDAVMMPNGNLLMLTWELIFRDELIALGRDPDEIAPQGYAWNERIIEVEMIGTNEINIVWEWKIRDHYIQDFDASLSNFGVVSEHPELFDINLAELDSPNSHSELDYNHFNAIDYNEALDQILISVRNSDEIWIIDHSTTTAEAASHQGGQYGKGGDILYRWGNPFSYDRADISEEHLFGQHGTHWIKSGPHAGKILIYNNGNGKPGTDFSTLEILVPDQNADGSYPVPATEPFGPLDTEWKYGDGAQETFYSPFLSNGQVLSNGNFLINAGSPGYIFEIDENRERVWEYVVPLFGDTPATQGANINNNGTFRAYRFPKDFAGFDGQDLTPGDPIENDPNPLDCDGPSSIQSLLTFDEVQIRNLGFGQFKIENNSSETITLQLFDMHGRLLELKTISNNNHSSFQTPLVSGIYFAKLNTNNGSSVTRKLMIQN